MISSLLGELQQKEDNALVVAVGGVGLRVAVPKGLAERLNIGEKVFLRTYMLTGLRYDADILFWRVRPRNWGACGKRTAGRGRSMRLSPHR